MKVPILKTERLVLRPITLDDAPAFQKYFNDWDIIKHMRVFVPWPYPDDGAITYICDDVLPKITEGKLWAWAITLKDGEGEAIGLINYRSGAEAGGNSGFWLAKKYQRQGLMSEAVFAVNDFRFDSLDVDSFVLSNVKGNIGSRRIQEQSGAIYLYDEHDEYHSGDVAEIWTITKESWLKAQNFK